MSGYGMNRGDYERAGVTSVTVGVTGGQRGFASDSHSTRSTSDAQAIATVAQLIDDEEIHDRFRGKFVEIIFSQTGHNAPKSLKKMVGTTGIEPVTPTMSR